MTAPRRDPAETIRQRAIERHPAGGADPERLVVGLVTAWLEVESGRRPLAHLAGVLSPTVHARLCSTLARRRSTARDRGRPLHPPGPLPDAVRALHVAHPADGVIEAAVAVSVAGRTTAVCVRLEAWGHGWRVTELARPEDGLTPVRSGTGAAVNLAGARAKRAGPPLR